MGKRKGLNVFLIITGLVFAVLSIVSFVLALVRVDIYGAIFGLVQSSLIIGILIRVLLLAKEANDSSKPIISKEDIDNISKKMK